MHHNLRSFGGCSSFNQELVKLREMQTRVALLQPLSVMLSQLTAASGSPYPPFIFSLFLQPTTTHSGPFHLPISAIFWQILASHSSPFSLLVFVLFWQLAIAPGSPSPSPISAISWQLAAADGSPLPPSFCQFLAPRGSSRQLSPLLSISCSPRQPTAAPSPPHPQFWTISGTSW